jgi:hypothetical protein
MKVEQVVEGELQKWQENWHIIRTDKPKKIINRDGTQFLNCLVLHFSFQPPAPPHLVSEFPGRSATPVM